MRRTALFPAFALALALAGCGGSEGEGVGVSGSYTGTYSGTYQTPQESGTINVAITSDGTVTSTVVSLTAPGQVGTLTGSVTKEGVIQATITYANPSAVTTFTGTLARDASGHLTGNLQGTTPTGSVTLTFDVNPT